jgi:hypothetical protein
MCLVRGIYHWKVVALSSGEISMNFASAGLARQIGPRCGGIVNYDSTFIYIPMKTPSYSKMFIYRTSIRLIAISVSLSKEVFPISYRHIRELKIQTRRESVIGSWSAHVPPRAERRDDAAACPPQKNANIQTL